MKPFLSLLTLLAFSGTVAKAQVSPAGTAQVPTSEISDADQKELAQALSLAITTNLWSKSLEWKETGATTKDVAAHLGKMLGNSAPSIEVRGKDEVRSTFALQKAILGPVLCSLAELANCRVWVFPGRLVIAKEEVLTDDERVAVKNQKAESWKQDSKGSTTRYLVRVAAPIIALDLKQRLAARGQTTPLAPPSNPESTSVASYELPFGQLSTDSQKLLQDMVNVTVPVDNPPVITPGMIVCLDVREDYGNSLFFKEPGVGAPLFKRYNWYISKVPPADRSR